MNPEIDNKEYNLACLLANWIIGGEMREISEKDKQRIEQYAKEISESTGKSKKIVLAEGRATAYDMKGL